MGRVARVRKRCVFPFLMLLTLRAFAAGTATWEMTSYQDFIKGKFQGVSLSRDGRLTLAPKLETLFSSEQPVIWTLAQSADGTLYAGTGHRGRLFRVDPAGKSTLLWTSEQPEIFAVAVDPKGVVYAATSPDGKIYRIENGKASEYFAPAQKYVWSLVFGSDGALYAGTGEDGKIFRIDAAGHGEEYYATGQGHVTSLGLDAQGRLLAGTEPNGILYRVSAKDKAFVLYDANLPEIRAVSNAPDGSIYAVALGGSLAKKTQAATQGSQSGTGTGTTPTVTTSITVTAESAGAPDIKPVPDTAKQTQQTATTATTTTKAAQVVDLTGVEKSALYKIHPDNTVETLWSSKEENIYDVLALPGQILFSTDANGRIYRLSPDRKLTLVTQTNEAEATRLLKSGNTVLASTGNMGRIYRLGGETSPSGAYESPVYDAQSTARWGRLNWQGETAGAKIALRTRTGNSLRPDRTWSDWSEPLSAVGSQIASPNARYIQWKVEMAGANPALDNVTVAYLPQNSAPTVKSINVVTTLTAAAPAKPSSTAASSAYSITVTDTGDAGPSSSTGTPTQTLSRAASQQIVVSWQAEDPDGDRLVYALYFRGQGEREWKLLKANVHENSYTIEGDVLADGRYFFRLVASDREVNPPSSAREAELVSSPVLIDNTPPVVTVREVKKNGAGVDVDFDGRDAASMLRRCEYALDAGAWTPLNAVDGVIDSEVESFHLHLEAVPAGEHVLVLRVVDSGNNAGLAKVILR